MAYLNSKKNKNIKPLTDYKRMMTRSQILYSQSKIGKTGKNCKMYENLNFLLKKWLNNAKSKTRDTQ